MTTKVWSRAWLAPLFVAACSDAGTSQDAVALASSVVKHDRSFYSYTETISSGVSTRIRTYSQWDKNCFAMMTPNVTIDQPPAHGTIEVKQGMNKIDGLRVGNTDCSGKTVYGSQVVFTPAVGYTGPDKTILTVQYADGFGRDTFDLTIVPKP